MISDVKRDWSVAPAEYHLWLLLEFQLLPSRIHTATPSGVSIATHRVYFLLMLLKYLLSLQYSLLPLGGTVCYPYCCHYCDSVCYPSGVPTNAVTGARLLPLLCDTGCYPYCCRYCDRAFATLRRYLLLMLLKYLLLLLRGTNFYFFGVPTSIAYGVTTATPFGVPSAVLCGVLTATPHGVPTATPSVLSNVAATRILFAVSSRLPTATLSGVPTATLH